MCRLAQTLAITNTSQSIICLLVAAPLLRNANNAMLRQLSQASLSFAPCAAAHSAKSVHRVAAHSASPKSMPLGHQLEFTATACASSKSKAAQAIKFASHAHLAKLLLGAQQAVSSRAAMLKQGVSCAKSIGRACAVQRLQLQSPSARTNLQRANKALANQSLNRTFCGVRQLGFISFSPNCRTPQNAG